MAVLDITTVGQAVTRAYRLLGNLEPPWVPSDDQMTQGMIAANLMMRGWQADGINLWRQERREITIPANTQSVEITPYVLGVEQVSWVVSPQPNYYTRPMAPYTYVDYFNLPNPLAAIGTPSVYMFDKQVNTSTLWIYPVAQFGGTVLATVARAVDAYETEQDALGVPVEWGEGYVYNLADRLMEDQAVASADPQTAARITQRAVAFYTKLLNFDRPTSVMIRPWGKAGQGRPYR
jgi:hypothetical protein